MSQVPVEPNLLHRLAASGLSMSEVMALVKEVEAQAPPSKTIRYGLSANVTVDLLGTYLRRQALLDGHHAQVQVGGYGDHLNNVRRFKEAGVDAIVLFNFFDNLIPSLEARLPSLDDSAIAAVKAKLRDELHLVLEEARDVGRVYLALLHRLAAPSAIGLQTRIDAVIDSLNQVLREEAAQHPNVHLLHPAEIISRLGWERAFSTRYYYRYRAPYTGAFFEELSLQLSYASRAGGTHYFKMLVLDADNTLWGGIVGEDLAAGLKLGPHDYPGNVFWYAQQEFLALQKQGVLLCLCSKNNPADVEAVLADHPHTVLRATHFVSRQVNWDDKPGNLRRIAAELNLGLDAMVFLDDSSFECEAVRGQLPMVRTLQVPANVFEYPALIQQVKHLFVGGGVSGEAVAKTEQYRVRALAEDERKRFSSQAEYLASLGLRVEIKPSDKSAIRRIAELTQKSNQFNLTTRRYSEGEIEGLFGSAEAEVVSIYVSDKFGDSGLTGVVIVRFQGDEVTVDSMLMSCRVIGRGVEFSFWRWLLDRAASRGARRVTARYLPSAKNDQVKDFYDRLGLPLVSDIDGQRTYGCALNQLNLPATPHIELIHER